MDSSESIQVCLVFRNRATLPVKFPNFPIFTGPTYYRLLTRIPRAVDPEYREDHSVCSLQLCVRIVLSPVIFRSLTQSNSAGERTAVLPTFEKGATRFPIPINVRLAILKVMKCFTFNFRLSGIKKVFVYCFQKPK